MKLDPEPARGQLPAVFERRIEDDVEVGRAAQPRVVQNLVLELPRPPARVAERNENVPRASSGDERVEDVARHGDRDVLALHRQRVLPRTGRAMQDEAALLHDRPPFHDRKLPGGVALGVGAAFHPGLLQHRPEVETRGPIDDEAHGPVLVMCEEVGHRAHEVRILERRHGDEKVVGQVHAHASDCGGI